jgi:hypothetical protein
MTSKAALCKVLLDGQVVNIRNIHQLTGFTNAGREIGRAIERKDDGGFGVLVSRTPMEGKNRFGVHCTWTAYRLNNTPYNKDGIKAMKKYVREQMKSKKVSK